MENNNWVSIAKKIESRYPFAKMNFIEKELMYMDIDGFLIQIDIHEIDNGFHIKVGKQNVHYLSVGDDLNEDFYVRIISQALFSDDIFRSYFVTHKNREALEKLENKINQLSDMINCAPGGPGYEAAKQHFEKLI